MKKFISFILFFILLNSQVFSQQFIIVGPQNDCAKGIGKNVHTDSKDFNIDGYAKLKITTQQHRTFDNSKIFDADSNKLLWEWKGESFEATWYTKEHFIEVNTKKIRVEFTQGFNDPFCNGFIKVEKISINNHGNISNNGDIEQANKPREIALNNIKNQEKQVSWHKVNCSRCDGSGKESVWVDPQECQNCVDWNSSYRSKVPCYICKDTRRTPNRRHKMITCTICKGTGRDYEQEKRNVEFGGMDYMLSTTSIATVYGLKVHEGIWRYRLGNDRYATKMTYAKAQSLCQSLGDGWRIPTFSELNLLFKAQKSKQYDLGFDGVAEYWTSTLSHASRLYFVLSGETKEGYGGYMDIGNSSGMYAGQASCKCVNSN